MTCTKGILIRIFLFNTILVRIMHIMRFLGNYLSKHQMQNTNLSPYNSCQSILLKLFLQFQYFKTLDWEGRAVLIYPDCPQDVALPFESTSFFRRCYCYTGKLIPQDDVRISVHTTVFYLIGLTHVAVENSSHTFYSRVLQLMGPSLVIINAPGWER